MIQVHIKIWWEKLNTKGKKTGVAIAIAVPTALLGSCDSVQQVVGSLL